MSLKRGDRYLPSFASPQPVKDAVCGMYERDLELEHAPLRLDRARAVHLDDVGLGRVGAKKLRA